MKKSNIANLTHSALLAAIYVCLSVLPIVNAFSYGPIQFRIAEILMMCCLISPHDVMGVSVGCFLANLLTPYGMNVFDLVLGTGATVLAAVLTYAMRSVFLKKKSRIFFAPLPTVLINGLVVGSYLPFLVGGSVRMYAMVYSIFTVAIGEAAVLYLLGIPFYRIISQKRFFQINHKDLR